MAGPRLSDLLASGLGAVPGAFFWGWLGDKIGRRTVFMLSAITISLATGVMVFTGTGRPCPGMALPDVLPLSSSGSATPAFSHFHN